MGGVNQRVIDHGSLLAVLKQRVDVCMVHVIRRSSNTSQGNITSDKLYVQIRVN